jgi:hypothetical protein
MKMHGPGNIKFKKASFLYTQQLANEPAHSVSKSHKFCPHTHTYIFNNNVSSASTARTQKKRVAHIILMGKPEVKRPPGRPRRR